ncbi:helix-turn-helix transcriptional regulator [Streptomyces subrutilus]|uniref:HTH domain-containing protein n=1 Tax=Streptomyces subrutilus TaxID=36818 RepID=A0A5P2UT67_9ACTN|nr:HTH domain-containing protein [Streptomyces subrutilus]QEU82378.1 HTH domain-containing protein [Streptomyces subrutilus]WSJ28159.1 HTH domain-containing protein [Streptomyces subrutilus]GGZ70480.1 transcriptional regulator [Streptomyces subrutilus]
MNRTERLYALVEELRAVSPRPRSARWLAERFGVSTRTIERDLGALQQSGVPLYAEPGRSGGYVVDKDHTLPPLTITPAEAAALAVALHALAGTPFAADARSALYKVFAVMPQRDRQAARELASLVRLPADPVRPTPLPPTLREALSGHRLLHLRYADARGETSDLTVEPLGFLGGDPWCLVGWCRLCSAAHGFRLDRIREARALEETVEPRPVDLSRLGGLGEDFVTLDTLYSFA